MASPRGLSGGKTESPGYGLICSSANVPGVPYKIKFGDFCPPFLKKIIFESSAKFWFRLVWPGLVLFGLAGFGLVWFGLAWFGLAWLGLLWLGLAWFGLAWLGLGWLGLDWLRLAWPMVPAHGPKMDYISST